MRALHLYAVCSTFYGSARASFRCSDMDALPGTKMMTIITGGLYAPLLMPLYVINDINRGYMSKNGLKYSDYDYPDKDTHIGHVLFS